MLPCTLARVRTFRLRHFILCVVKDHCAVESDGKLYFFGGLTTRTRVTNTLYVLDTTADDGVWSWAEVEVTGKLPPPRFDHSMVLVENEIIVFGGRHSPKASVTSNYNDLYRLDLSTLNWEHVGPPLDDITKSASFWPSPRSGHAAVSNGSWGDQMIVLGGNHDVLSSTADDSKVVTSEEGKTDGSKSGGSNEAMGAVDLGVSLAEVWVYMARAKRWAQVVWDDEEDLLPRTTGLTAVATSQSGVIRAVIFGGREVGKSAEPNSRLCVVSIEERMSYGMSHIYKSNFNHCYAV